MILTNLQNTARIEALHPRFKMLFDYVKSHDILHTPCGRIELDGDNLFINNVNPECMPAETSMCRFCSRVVKPWGGRRSKM